MIAHVSAPNKPLPSSALVYSLALAREPCSRKSSAAWKMPEMETPVAVASWRVVVAARPEKAYTCMGLAEVEDEKRVQMAPGCEFSPHVHRSLPSGTRNSPV